MMVWQRRFRRSPPPAAESIGVDLNKIKVSDEEEVEQSTDVTDEQAQDDAQEDVQSERQTLLKFMPTSITKQSRHSLPTRMLGLGFINNFLRRQSGNSTDYLRPQRTNRSTGGEEGS